MNIIIMGKHESTVIQNAAFIPRVGDNVDMFYKPMPIVTSIILYPKKSSYADFNLDIEINAIVIVD